MWPLPLPREVCSHLPPPAWPKHLKGGSDPLNSKKHGGRFTGKIVAVVIAVIILAVAIPVVNATADSPLSAITFVNGNTISVNYYSAVPVVIDPTTPDYEAEEDTVTYSGVTYNAVNIANDDNPNGAVADTDGNVNVTLDLNDNRPFCFEIHHINGENSKLRIIVTIGDETTQYTSNISGNVHHYIGATDKYFGMNAMVASDDWIQSDSPVNVQIYNYNGHVPDNVTLKIVFKPTS